MDIEIGQRACWHTSFGVNMTGIVIGIDPDDNARFIVKRTGIGAGQLWYLLPEQITGEMTVGNH